MPATQPHIDEFQLSPLRIGPEIEYPASPELRSTFRAPGQSAGNARDWAREVYGDITTDIAGVQTQFGRDGTVSGPEIRPTGNGVLYRDVDEWYESVVRVMEEEYGEALEPVGRMGSSGSTAGYHMHLSPLDESTARTLWEWSQEPWMQVFVCSTLVDPEYATSTAAVFRGDYSGYCRFEGFNQGRYNAVHRVGRSSSGHYEWRLPEPMRPDHFALVVEFLTKLYCNGEAEARQFAQELVANADERITAIRRAREIGLVDRLGHDDPFVLTMTRTPSLETADFFQRARQARSAPYIYRVRRGESEYYYFRSSSAGDSEWTDSVTGTEVSDGELLHADDLTQADDDDLLDQVETEMAGARAARPFDPASQTDATGYLVDTLLDEMA